MVEAWASNGPWLTEHRPRLGPGVAGRFQTGRQLPKSAAEPADGAGAEVRELLERVLAPGGALVLPAAVSVAPPPRLERSAADGLRARLVSVCCLAGLSGAPAVSLPLARVEGLPVGVCLVARPGDDERLLAAAAVFRRTNGG
jgi:amidase